MTAADKVSALSFDGVDDYVEYGTQNDIQSPPFTLEAWVYPNALHDGVIFNKGNTDTEPAYEFRLKLDGTIIFRSYDGTAVTVIASTGLYTVSSWNHVVCVVDASDNVQFYINGVDAGSGTITIATPFASSLPLRLGKLSFTNSWFLNGLADEAHIYNRALSADEILYNKEHPHAPILNGLVLWLSGESLDYANGIWQDASGNGNNGTLYGPTELKMNRLAGRILTA